MAKVALAGQPYGYFAPTYKILTEVFEEARSRLAPVAQVASKSEKRIELITGGVIEFWTLEDPDAGRSRRYKEIAVDEAGLVRDLEDCWFRSIRPTLADFAGTAWFAGTPKGRNFFHTAFAKGQDPEQPEWESWQRPTVTNPYILASEIEAARLELPERAFRQEFLAEFLDDAGGVFHGVRECIDQGERGPRDGLGPFTIGVDLARTQDFTVLSVLDSDGRQLETQRFNTVSWDRQIDLIQQIAARYPNCKLVVDSTGVGDPIYERLSRLGLSVDSFKFTSASKGPLIENLAMRIERGEVRLLDVPVQADELLAYEYQVSKSGHISMNAPEGMHDDTVIALALAAWGMARRRVPNFY